MSLNHFKGQNHSESFAKAEPLAKYKLNPKGSESIEAVKEITTINHFNLNEGKVNSESINAVMDINLNSSFAKNGRKSNKNESSESITKAFTSVNSRFADFARRH